MKISVITASGQDRSHLKLLLIRLNHHRFTKELEEIILMETLDGKSTPNLNKGAYTSVYVRGQLSDAQKFDMGAMAAKGDILFF